MVLSSSASICASSGRNAAAARMLWRSSSVQSPSSSVMVQRSLQRQLPPFQRRAAFHTSKRPTASHLSSSTPLRSSLPISQARTLFTRKAPPSPIRSFLTTSLLVAGGIFFVAYYLDSRSAIHRWVAIPFLKTVLDPESAQKLAINLLASGAAPRDLFEDDEVLKAEIFGKELSNPIGLAAGFDKQAEAIDGLFNLGFGIVEVGSVTPEPQPGNPLPRYFRLTADNAAINRFGFNSEGHNVILGRLRDRIRRWLLHESGAADMHLGLSAESSKQAAQKLLATHPDSVPALADAAGLPRSLNKGKLLSINLGKNKSSEETDVSDYVKGVHRLGPYADMIVVNVSSPNTPNLRRLQRRGVLNDLLKQVVEARDEMLRDSGIKLRESGKPGLTTPLLVKIAPDLDEAQLHDVADAVLESGVDGIIISNTTIQRPTSLISTKNIHEQGGLSGPPLKPLAIKALTTVRQRVGPEMTIIGCGGIYTAEDACDFAKAGASAVQLYTSFGYEGVGHPRRLKDDLVALLKKEGTTWKQLIGSGIDAESVRETKAKSGAELEDLYRRETAGLKAKLEELRGSFSTGGPSDEEKRLMTDSAAEGSTAVTALPYFKPDPSDTGYVKLLENVHAVLGSEPVWEGKQSRKPTQGEQVDAALDEALKDPRVPAYASVQGSAVSAPGESAISADPNEDGKGSAKGSPGEKKGSSNSSSGVWSKIFSAKKPEGSDADKSGKGRDLSDSGEARSKFLVGMDGPRPDLKAADTLRVV